MKRVFLVLLSIILFATLSFAGSKQANFSWKMTSVTNLKSFNIKYSLTAGGPYTLLANIPYTAPQTTYTSSQNVTLVPDGSKQTIYFVCTAVATSGIETGPSNEVSAEFDFTTVGVPFQFTITIS